MTAGVADTALQSTPESPRAVGMPERGPGPAGRGRARLGDAKCRLIGGSGSRTFVTGTSDAATSRIVTRPSSMAVTIMRRNVSAG